MLWEDRYNVGEELVRNNDEDDSRIREIFFLSGGRGLVHARTRRSS